MSSNPSNTPSVVVVSVENCVQCKATYRDLAKFSVEHVVDLDPFSPDHSLARSLGHMQAPAVLVRSRATGELLAHWSGFRPDLIAGLQRSTAGDFLAA